MTWTVAEGWARAQRGLVTRKQLERLELKEPAIRWALESGKLVRVFRGVYRFRLVPVTWEQRALAATLFSGGGSALSHWTAARLWKLPCAGQGAQNRIHLSALKRRPSLPGDFVVHQPTRAFVPFTVDTLPVTRLARTLVDLAGELSVAALEQTLDAAHLRCRSLQGWLEEEVEGLKPKHTPGLSALLELLKLRRGVSTESPLETRIRRRLRERGIEEDQLQHEVRDAQGVIMRVDFAWGAEKVALHGDGYRWHADRKQFDRDHEQRGRLAAADWTSLSVTWTTVERDDWLDQLEVVLEKRRPQLELFRESRP